MTKVISLPADIGTEVSASHLPVGGLLDGDHPLSRDTGLSFQPVPDEGLAGVHVLGAVRPHLVGQLSLATGNLNGPLERNNVRFLHKRTEYTTQVVKRNTPGCVTPHNIGCTVTPLPVGRKNIKAVNSVARKLKQPKPAPKKKAAKGVDGKTLGERLEDAMKHRAGVLGIEEYNQMDLWRDSNRIAGGTELAQKFSQQTVSKILIGETNESKVTPFLAMACGVSAFWLASGIGGKLDR